MSNRQLGTSCRTRGAGGFQQLSAVIKNGGFGRVRKATETPFNMILEARA
ncbi:MAG: hypothetical protein WAV18_16780 [Roseiarcus sp.]